MILSAGRHCLSLAQADLETSDYDCPEFFGSMVFGGQACPQDADRACPVFLNRETGKNPCGNPRAAKRK